MNARVYILCGLAFAAVTPDPGSLCFAQSAGTISGTVRDAGGVVPGAEVLLLNQSTGVKTTAPTDETGYYQFLIVPVGTYRLVVSLPGFKTSQVSDIKVDIRSNRIVDVLLEVGEVTETVTVEASLVAQVELRSGEVGNLVPGEQVTELPLNGRNFQQLALTVPGVSLAESADMRRTHLFARNPFTSSGGLSTDNMWLVDGSNNVDLGSGMFLLVFPSVDSIAEFKIQRNSYGAELPAGAAAQIDVVTRGGANRFHGTLYEFHRNDNLNAANFFLNRYGEPKQALAYNNFGYTVGGPIVRDKAFFFWSQEWRVERRGTPRQALVPTELERDGDFSGPNSVGNDPLDPYTGAPFPGNGIPRDRQSPAGRAFIAIYPHPTLTMDDPRVVEGGYNWVAAPSSNIDTRQENIRVDYHPGARHTLMGRYTRDLFAHGDPTWSYYAGGPAWGDDIFPSIDSKWRSPTHNLATQWTTVFGAGALNQVSFNWSFNSFRIRPGPGEELSQTLLCAGGY